MHKFTGGHYSSNFPYQPLSTVHIVPAMIAYYNSEIDMETSDDIWNNDNNKR